ncbi:MAG: ATP-binding protein [Thermodesulfobacteriota bacterium]
MGRQDEAYFSVDSRLLFQLGEKLVTDRAVALAELVKNSYDADATLATIRMQHVQAKGGSIIIQDNGTGMTLQSFMQTWMRIATIDKEQNPLSPRYGRKKAGEKGIGRFACRRLSEVLVLESTAEVEGGKKETLKAEFIWASFEPGKDVNAQPVMYTVAPTSRQANTGTTLTLKGTTEPWSLQDIRRLRIHLLDLISPLTFKTELKDRPETHDPGFEVDFDCPGFEVVVEPLDKAFFRNAWAKLLSSVDDEGFASYDLRCAKGVKGQTDKRYRREEPFRLLRNARMEVYIFSYRTDFFKNSEWKMAQTQKIGDERGGIKVYADSFRVFGYGDKGDDWLGTDYDRARSLEKVDEEITSYAEEDTRPGLHLFRNNNLFGHVVFSREDNKALEITVNRERIVSGEAFLELRRFARLGIDFATVLYANQVAKEKKEKEEKAWAREQARAKAAEEARKKAYEARLKAEQEAKRAEQEKIRAQEEEQSADRDAAMATQARRDAEERRRKAEMDRRIAEEEARQTGSKDAWVRFEAAIRRESEFIRAERLAIEDESRAAQNAKEVRERAEGQRAAANDEAQKALNESRKAEEAQRKAEEDELNRKRDKWQKEYLLLRVLASTGTLILIFEHELQALIDDMEEMLSTSSELLTKMPQAQQEGFKTVLDSFSTRTEMVKDLGEFLGLTMGAQSRTERREWVVRPIVDSVFRPFTYYLGKIGITYRNTVPNELRTPPMYRAELVSALHNLMTNAVKAVRGGHKRDIEVTGSVVNGTVHILFLDSGKGLDRQRWEIVFEPFESDSEPDIKFGVGTGLGLKIVRDIVRSYGGEARFCQPPDGWTTCAELTLPMEESGEN